MRCVETNVAHRRIGAREAVSRSDLQNDVPTPAQRHLSNTSSLREAAILGAMAMFKNSGNSLRSDMVQLLRDDVQKQVEGLPESADDGDILNLVV
jgi:hypothetical protein